MKQVCIVCYLTAKEGHRMQLGAGVDTGEQKVSRSCMSIRNLTRGIISNLVETEILGRWNDLVRKKERNAIWCFINVQLSH